MRRSIWLAGVAVLLAVFVAGSGAVSAQQVKMVFASAYAPDDHQSRTLQEFARLAKEHSNGRLQIDVAVGGVLGGERDVAEGIQLGAVDGAILGGILQNFDPAMAILEFPFLFKNDAHVQAVMDGPVGEQIRQRLIATTGIHILDYVMRTPRELTTNRPVRSLADVKGMKIRVPEMEAHLATWRALGANPTPLAFPEVYTALQLGTVDGQENPLGVIYANKFYEVVDYITLTDHLVGFMLIVMNDERYQRLSPELQRALTRAAAEASEYNDRILKEQNDFWESQVFGRMTVTRPDMEPWREATKDVYKQFLKYDGFEELYLAIREVGERF
ncbi:TRAP transporter substrate-binding protein [Limnochorda pilosa]|uniref:C4-dicarboxylate ABC transporter substrate-binding protein n=1 Tax=Limnochorda pilosa TaxID=1555112 RepID=A0A0K2SLE6_LIMPI|nr:TRAP transporter substrate-binding protein [Limnochorda pilosa]BAS27943.1 C4-dicarboxylate ABC transporter substrate-binding protein [Limnochorda pilosa]